MKKLLVVLLAMVLVLGMATSAYAYTDTDSLSTVQQDGIYRLSALGVLNGYPDGTFGAANSITRAEFAKIACELSGLGDVSDTLKSTPSSFSDVAVNMWYTGYVNIASSQGFINGYPDGTFKPNKTISMAEVVTILLRIAGYDDNLPGPWPFDYIAQAGKVDVTDDVTFVSNVAATRADVAVMANALLDVTEVDWNSDTSKFEDVLDSDDNEITVLDDSFDATTADVMFDNSKTVADAIDAWDYTDFNDNEITLSGNLYDEDTDLYNGDSFDYVMNNSCYFAGGKSLTDIGGMTADLILNEDNEVIYVKFTSTVGYTDDIDGTMVANDLEINGDSVDSVDVADNDGVGDDDSFALWNSDTNAVADAYTLAADNNNYDYAKVFYNEDGDVYAVETLEGDNFAADSVSLVDSYDTNDETITALDGDDVDLDGADYVIFKDGASITADKVAKGDVLYVFEDTNHADFVIIDKAMATGSLSEGSDDTLTIADKDYYFDGDTDYTLDGVDGDFAALNDITLLDDAFSTDIQFATTLNPYQLAFVVANAASTDKVYGVVTDLTVGGLFDKIQDITILNQTGKEVTYDVDNSDDILVLGHNPADDSNVVLGAYVEVRLNADGEVDTVDDIILPETAVVTPDNDMPVSGSKIQINGVWYKITDSTLFFNDATDGVVGADTIQYTSDDFDEASLIANADVLGADTVAADGVVIASKDGSTLERVYFVDSDVTGSNDNYGFVDKLYTNADGDYVKMLDGVTAERKDGQHYTKNVFFSYDINNDEMEVTPIVAFPAVKNTAVVNSPITDGYWVLANGSVDTATAHEGNVLNLDAVDLTVQDFDGKTLKVANNYYDFTDTTVVYTIDADGVADLGDDSDIDDGDTVLIISDEDGNAMYVFDLTNALVIASVTSPEFTTHVGDDTVTVTLTDGTFKAGAITAADFTFAGTDAAVFTAGGVVFTRTSDTVVTITGIGALAGADNNTVTVKAATQATTATSVAVVSANP